MRNLWPFLLLSSLAAAGCADPSATGDADAADTSGDAALDTRPFDAGATDGGRPEAGADAPAADAVLDVAAPDAGERDAPSGIDAPPSDGGADAPALDAPLDAPITLTDASTDAGTDAPIADAPTDAGLDAPMDAPLDTPSDAGAPDGGRPFAACGLGAGYDPLSPWPTWGRCPGRTSHAGSVGIAAVGSVTNVTVSTTSSLFTALNGLDGVAIAGSGAVYVNGALMRAYDATGAPLWFVSGAPSPTGASIGADGTVYFAASTQLIAVRPDGTERWQFTLSEPGPTGAPAIGSDGTIYVATEFALYGVTSAGAMRFRASFGNAYNGPPAIAPDGSVYVAGRIALHAYTAAGVGRWDLMVPLGNAITSAVHVTASGDVLYGHGSTTTFRVSLVNGATGVERWRLTVPSPARTFAIGPDGTIYAVCDNLLVAISPGGVEERRISGTSFGQPLIGSDGTLYVTDSNVLRAIRPDGSMLFSRRVDLSSHGPAMAADGSLVLSGGTTLTYVRP